MMERKGKERKFCYKFCLSTHASIVRLGGEKLNVHILNKINFWAKYIFCPWDLSLVSIWSLRFQNEHLNP